jgi:heme-degrading monooxygenase HmoA
MARFFGYIRIGRKENFEKFKPFFDAASNARKSAGSKGGYLFRDAEDPNHVIILLEWDNLEKAKEYIQSEYVKNIMVEAGNIGTPEDILIELVEKVKF